MKKISLVPLVCLVATTIFAQDKTADIDKIFSWATPTAPGCVCAVAQNGKIILNRAYGAADLEREVPLNTNSIFDIGSLMKQFVALKSCRCFGLCGSKSPRLQTMCWGTRGSRSQWLQLELPRVSIAIAG